MQPKGSSHKIVDLRFKSRHAVSNERPVGIYIYVPAYFLKVTPVELRNSTRQPAAEDAPVMYCGTQGIQRLPMLQARAPIGLLDAAPCAFPIPALHVRIETGRSPQ